MAERAVGLEFAVSIATAEAFEKKILVDNRSMDEVWINVRTLARNFWGSYKKEERPALHELYPVFAEELQTIKALESTGVKINYYLPSYESIKTGFSHASLRVAKTDNQKEYQNAEDSLSASVAQGPSLGIVMCDSKIPAPGGKVFLLTHFPVDLLSRFAFEYVELLESSTGVSKPPTDWNTKINLPKDYRLMPFNELTLQVYGDKGKHFNAMPAGYKNALTAVAIEGGWKLSTRKDKMRMDIKKMENVAVMDTFLKMLYGVIR